MSTLTAMHAHDVVVVGGLNSDFLINGAVLPRAGETLDGVDFMRGSGGKGGNQAVAAARLGARVAMIACVGNDQRGVELIAELNMEGVDTSSVHVVEGEITGAAVIMVDQQGRKMIMVAPGANRRLSPGFITSRPDIVRSARVLLLQLEAPMETVHEVLSLARTAGVTTLLDAAPGRQLHRDLVCLVDLLRCNAAEAEVLTGIAPVDRDSALEAGHRILRMGAGAACVQAGSMGDQLVSHELEYFVPVVDAHSIDSTGAGDALSAGIAAELARGETIRNAVRFANAAAALATTRLGARQGLPWRSEVSALLERNDGDGRHST